MKIILIFLALTYALWIFFLAVPRLRRRLALGAAS